MNIISTPQRPQSWPAQAVTVSTMASQSVTQTNLDRLISRANPVKHVVSNLKSPLPPPVPPRFALTPERQAGATSFVQQLDVVVGGFESQGELSPDRMMTEFLKLNLLDPNNSIETHNLLSEAMSTLRQKSIDESLAASERAQELKQEAENYASVAAIISGITSVLSICGGFAASLQALMTIQAAMSAGVNQALTESIKSSVLQGIEKAVKDLGENACEEAMSKAVEEAVMQSVGAAAEEAVTSALAELPPELIVDELGKKVVCDAIKAMGQKALENVTNPLIKEAAQQGIEAATDDFVFEIIIEAVAKTSMVESGRKIVNGSCALRQSNLSAQSQNMSLVKDKFQNQADAAQDSVENEQALLQTLVESRNQVVSSAMKMLQERESVNNKLNGLWAA